MSYDSIKVYSSDVDFNGALVGSKTLLTKGVDYEITYKGVDSTRPIAEISLIKSIGKKAVIAESVISGINGKITLTNPFQEMNTIIFTRILTPMKTAHN